MPVVILTDETDHIRNDDKDRRRIQITIEILLPIGTNNSSRRLKK